MKIKQILSNVSATEMTKTANCRSFIKRGTKSVQSTTNDVNSNTMMGVTDCNQNGLIICECIVNPISQ